MTKGDLAQAGHPLKNVAFAHVPSADGGANNPGGGCVNGTGFRVPTTVRGRRAKVPERRLGARREAPSRLDARRGSNTGLA